MHDLSHHVKVEGRVLFRTAEDAELIARQLRAGDTGTVLAHPAPDAKISVTGRSLRLAWSGLAAGNDHEHTYMWLTQAIESASKGAFIVSGDDADTVFCLMEEYATDHLSKVIGTLWSESGESEFLRDNFDCADSHSILQLWDDLDTWIAKSGTIMYIFDCLDVQHVPEAVKSLLNDLWNTPEPVEKSSEAESLEGEAEAYWFIQAVSLDRFIPDEDIYDQIANELEGELRQKKHTESVKLARSHINAQA